MPIDIGIIKIIIVCNQTHKINGNQLYPQDERCILLRWSLWQLFIFHIISFFVLFIFLNISTRIIIYSPRCIAQSHNALVSSTCIYSITVQVYTDACSYDLSWLLSHATDIIILHIFYSTKIFNSCYMKFTIIYCTQYIYHISLFIFSNAHC